MTETCQAKPLHATDLDHICEKTKPLWDELRDTHIFITGGTGFFGCWLLESLVWINNKLSLNVKATVLTRDKNKFAEKCPHLATNTSLHFIEGDVIDFKFPTEKYSHIIHAATEASATLNANQPLAMLDTIIQGTKHTLEFAKICAAKKFLFTSSGAIYGKQAGNNPGLKETDLCHIDPTDSSSAYALGKSTAEFMVCQYAKEYCFEAKIARCFAFVGPHLPLDGTYAIGNFLRDASAGNEITMSGDGTTLRSYLYAADLAVWLWTILFRGHSCRPYNVGSDQSHSITELANMVADNFTPRPKISTLQKPVPGKMAARYVPDISRAQTELNLFQTYSLHDAIQLTRQWHLLNQEIKLNTVA